MKKFHTALLIGILCIGIFLRFWKLGQIPNGLNRDEASLGYTAYSILHTGKDEHGKTLPINLQSFGDWKLPLYVYLSIPIISVLGLNEFSIRLLSALAGVSILIYSYFLLELLVKKWKAPSWLPLLGMGTLAISPWAVHLSRVAYEANVALAFCVAGIFISFSGIFKKKYWLLPIGAVCLGLTLIGYHAFQIFTPLMVLFTAWLLHRDFSPLDKKQLPLLLISVVIFCVPILLLFFDKAVQSNQTKYSGISIFSEKFLSLQQNEVNPILTQKGLTFLQPLYSSPPIQLGKVLTQNIFSMVNPNFLFIQGGSHGSHNVPGIGNMYWFAAISLLFGITLFFKQREKWQIWLIGWLGIAMIAPLLTIEANHSVRFFPAVIPLEVISAFGIGVSLQRITARFPKQKTFVQDLFIGIIGLNFIHFFITYFLIFSVAHPDRWPWFMKELIATEQQLEPEYSQVFMQGERSSPYIYFLFNHPKDFLSQTREYYPSTEEGFVHVKSLGKIQFGKIDWASLEAQQKPILFIVTPAEVPGDKLSNSRYTILKKISLTNSEITYWFMELR